MGFKGVNGRFRRGGRRRCPVRSWLLPSPGSHRVCRRLQRLSRMAHHEHEVRDAAAACTVSPTFAPSTTKLNSAAGAKRNCRSTAALRWFHAPAFITAKLLLVCIELFYVHRQLEVLLSRTLTQIRAAAPHLLKAFLSVLLTHLQWPPAEYHSRHFP